MHYIVGTKITVNTQPHTRRGPGPRSVGAVQTRRAVVTDKFHPGQRYTLHYIKKNSDGKVLYTFKNDTDGEQFQMAFESATAGDLYIAKILGDVLPDYNKFYEKNKG
jgi:hypothetical protein